MNRSFYGQIVELVGAGAGAPVARWWNPRIGCPARRTVRFRQACPVQLRIWKY